MFVGIDGGLKGGIVVIDANQKIIKKWIMPILKGAKTTFNIKDIIDIFQELFDLEDPDKIFVVLEKAHPRPIQGVRSAFTTGYCYGMFEALLQAHSVSYTIVNPTVWMKSIFKGNNTKDKKASVIFCQCKWPKEDWTATEKSRIAHDGLTDATCMALYCLEQFKGK